MGSAQNLCKKGSDCKKKNPTYSDFFYFYNSSNSISLSVSGLKVIADGIFQ